jgi:hypothetical protein
MLWHLSWRADPRARALADRHYSRRSPGAGQFAPPGRCVVLLTEGADALWVSSRQRPRWVRHAWPDAWVCSLFRNESGHLSSGLIRQAVAATRWLWGAAPRQGVVTFVDPARVRRKRDPGRCFRKAGWAVCGRTAGGLLALGLPPGLLPPPEAPLPPRGSLPF